MTAIRILVVVAALGWAMAPADAHADPLASGLALYRAGNPSAAHDIFAARVEAAPDDHRAWFHLAEARMALRDFPAAVAALDRAVAAAPQASHYHRLRGEALGRTAEFAPLLKQLGLAKRALRALQTAVEVGPDDIEARDSLLEYHIQAPRIAGGNRAEAEIQARAMAALDPARGEIAWARIHETAKRYDEAAAHYRAAIQHAPALWRAWDALGRFQIGRQDWAGARQTYGAMLRRDDADMVALYRLAEIAAGSGQDLSVASKALERYLDWQPTPGAPSLADAHHQAGRLALRRGDDERARRSFQTALRLQPDHRDAKRALRRL